MNRQEVEALYADKNPLTGILLKVVSVAAFVAMASLIKAAGRVPAGEIVFFRSAFAILPILILLAWRHELRSALKTARPFSHVARGLVGVTSMGLGFFALTRLPLPEAITLNYAQPLLVVVFSALFMGEVVRLFRWSAVVVGLVGVVIISWPKLTLFTSGSPMGNDEALGVTAALLAAGVSAIAMLLVRRLVHTEKTATIVLWFSLTSTVAALGTIPFGWDALSAAQIACLVGAGICGGVGQILMTESYRHASMSTIAPFEYSSMILGIAVGFFVFGDLPTIYTLVGGTIVVGAGLFIIWREQRLGLKRGQARKVTPPT
ncbi:DMT family transporter [Aliihoeflea sp. 40Bstr573]|uniref:DMT family transporter n=1 Tax=Aliihoeflea sp. 40Bstr573 TaxID=2696467 RepID=UPI00209438FF|nr:DMT family transporter [Aliihoeflea sp. 40Bstr573]MCO6388608.1 EamA family transporter [Aliihoeflea sp. 40Bstr573]